MIPTQNSTIKPERTFTFHPDFKDWGGVVYQEETVNGKRHYTINGVAYPSITTVLSYDPLKKEILRRWRKRVGEVAAEQIRVNSSVRGKSLHKLCEDYLQKHEAVISTYEERENFFKVKPVIEQNIGQIYCIETALFSDSLGVAGRCDLIAEWNVDGAIVPAVIDFKTSTRTKYRKDIYNYFIQGAAYARMFRDMTGIEVPKVVIVMASEEVKDCQVFVENTLDWNDALDKAITTYRENVNVTNKETPSYNSLRGI